mmetsp:Transcript_23294/g.52645  ORF Transcript_23294/g.52645 Transcript_23294/m.52645 type:complete len:244 (-) Transcript_23294:44-775(-)
MTRMQPPRRCPHRVRHQLHAILHHLPQLVHIIHHQHHIQCLDPGLYPHHPEQELLDIHKSTTILIQTAEQRHSLVDIQPGLGKKRPDCVFLEDGIKFIQADPPTVVHVGLRKDGAELLQLLAKIRHLPLQHSLSVLGGGFHGLLHKNSCDDIQHGNRGESQVGDEEPQSPGSVKRDWSDHHHAPGLKGSQLKKGEHGATQVPKKVTDDVVALTAWVRNPMQGLVSDVHEALHKNYGTDQLEQQ